MIDVRTDGDVKFSESRLAREKPTIMSFTPCCRDFIASAMMGIEKTLLSMMSRA